MLFPYVDPIVAVDFPLALFQRAEVDGSAAHLFARENIAHDRRSGFFRFFGGEKALYKHVRLYGARQIFFHIIPINGAVALQGDNIVYVAHGYPVRGVIPHYVGNEFAAFRRRSYGKFDVFHTRIIARKSGNYKLFYQRKKGGSSRPSFFETAFIFV